MTVEFQRPVRRSALFGYADAGNAFPVKTGNSKSLACQRSFRPEGGRAGSCQGDPSLVFPVHRKGAVRFVEPYAFFFKGGFENAIQDKVFGSAPVELLSRLQEPGFVSDL